jgi:hypothetical protein
MGHATFYFKRRRVSNLGWRGRTHCMISLCLVCCETCSRGLHRQPYILSLLARTTHWFSRSSALSSKVDTLKFSICDSKHDFMYKTLKHLATGLVSRQEPYPKSHHRLDHYRCGIRQWTTCRCQGPWSPLRLRKGRAVPRCCKMFVRFFVVFVFSSPNATVCTRYLPKSGVLLHI